MLKVFFISRRNNDYHIAGTEEAAKGKERGASYAVDHRFAHAILRIRLKEGETKPYVLMPLTEGQVKYMATRK